MTVWLRKCDQRGQIGYTFTLYSDARRWNCGVLCFVGSWCCPAMDSDVGHIIGILIWLEMIFCWTWKEMNCASNTRHKNLSSKQKLLNAYFNSKSGCCPILRNLHDSTQYLILIEMMDAWESLRWPFPGCCFSSPREVARVARWSRHYIRPAPGTTLATPPPLLDLDVLMSGSRGAEHSGDSASWIMGRWGVNWWPHTETIQLECTINSR